MSKYLTNFNVLDVTRGGTSQQNTSKGQDISKQQNDADKNLLFNTTHAISLCLIIAKARTYNTSSR